MDSLRCHSPLSRGMTQVAECRFRLTGSRSLRARRTPMGWRAALIARGKCSIDTDSSYGSENHPGDADVADDQGAVSMIERHPSVHTNCRCNTYAQMELQIFAVLPSRDRRPVGPFHPASV